MEITEFKCLKCGNCCKTLVGSERKLIDYEPPCFIGEGVSPIIALAIPTLNIMDWEKDLFPKDVVVPNLIVYDLISNRTIVINYTLNTESCPLVKEDNTCSVYENRPLQCKSFPNPYRFSGEGLKTPSNAFGLCKGEMPLESLSIMMGFKKIDDKHMTLNHNELNKNLYKRYGMNVIYGEIEETLTKEGAELLMKLQKAGKIKLARTGYDMKYLIKKIYSSKHIGISKFLEECGLGSIEAIATNKDNIEKIKALFEAL